MVFYCSVSSHNSFAFLIFYTFFFLSIEFLLNFSTSFKIRWTLLFIEVNTETNNFLAFCIVLFTFILTRRGFVLHSNTLICDSKFHTFKPTHKFGVKHVCIFEQDTVVLIYSTAFPSIKVTLQLNSLHFVASRCLNIHDYVLSSRLLHNKVPRKISHNERK